MSLKLFAMPHHVIRKNSAHLSCEYAKIAGLHMGGQWRSQGGGGAQGAPAPPFFSRKCDTCSLYYAADQLFAKQITSYVSQRDLLSI